MLAEPVAVVTQYTVCALPEDNANYSLYAITVDRIMGYHGVNGWACRWMGRCLNAAGRWDYEPIPSSRTDAWVAAHRHPLDTALTLAKAAAPRTEVNGISVAEVLVLRRGAAGG